MESTIITIILPALIASVAITSAILVILHPKKYFLAESVDSILESNYEVN